MFVAPENAPNADVLVFSVFLELARDLVLERVELLDELLARVLVQHVAVHEPRGVAEADELHHLGEHGDGVDGADDGAGEPHQRRRAGDVRDNGGLVLSVLPLVRDGLEHLVGVDLGVRAGGHGDDALGSELLSVGVFRMATS